MIDILYFIKKNGQGVITHDTGGRKKDDAGIVRTYLKYKDQGGAIEIYDGDDLVAICTFKKLNPFEMFITSIIIDRKKRKFHNILIRSMAMFLMARYPHLKRLRYQRILKANKKERVLDLERWFYGNSNSLNTKVCNIRVHTGSGV